MEPDRLVTTSFGHQWEERIRLGKLSVSDSTFRDGIRWFLLAPNSTRAYRVDKFSAAVQ